MYTFLVKDHGLRGFLYAWLTFFLLTILVKKQKTLRPTVGLFYAVFINLNVVVMPYGIYTAR